MLARQLEAQQMRGPAQPVRHLLEGQSTERPHSPDRGAPDANSSEAAALAPEVAAEVSTELMWQPDASAEAGSIQGFVQQSEQATEPHSPSQSQSQLQLQSERGCLHEQSLRSQLQAPPESQSPIQSQSPSRSRPRLTPSSYQYSLFEGQLQPLHEAPSRSDASLQPSRPGTASSSPGHHRHALEHTQTVAVPQSSQQHMSEVTLPAEHGSDPLSEAEQPQAFSGHPSHHQLSRDHELALSDGVHARSSQPGQHVHMASVTQQQATGRSTLTGFTHAQTAEASMRPTGPDSVGNQLLDEVVASQAEHKHGQQAANHASSETRAWSRQQLSYEDSSEAVAAGVNAVPYHSLREDGLALAPAVVGQEAEPAAQQRPEQAAAVDQGLLDGRHTGQGRLLLHLVFIAFSCSLMQEHECCTHLPAWCTPAAHLTQTQCAYVCISLHLDTNVSFCSAAGDALPNGKYATKYGSGHGVEDWLACLQGTQHQSLQRGLACTL